MEGPFLGGQWTLKRVKISTEGFSLCVFMYSTYLYREYIHFQLGVKVCRCVPMAYSSQNTENCRPRRKVCTYFASCITIIITAPTYGNCFLGVLQNTQKRFTNPCFSKGNSGRLPQAKYEYHIIHQMAVVPMYSSASNITRVLQHLND